MMAMGIREAEELEITRVEKLLILGLVVFLLIGAFWTIDRLDNQVPRPVLAKQAYDETYFGPEWARQAPRQAGPTIEESLGIPPLRTRVKRLQATVDQRLRTRNTAADLAAEADRQYQYSREEYRTGMEAKRWSREQDEAYQRNRVAYLVTFRRRDAAEAALKRAETELSKPREQLRSLEKRSEIIYERRTHQRDWLLFALNFTFAGICLLVSWKIWKACRNAQWRFLSIATAFLAASVIQLIFLAFRYCWEILHDLAQLGVALIGSFACIAAIVALKRYVFRPDRLARSRLAGGGCPNCSTRFEPGQAYCWDCGRSLLEACPHCGAAHLRYAPYCAACGKSTT